MIEKRKKRCSQHKAGVVNSVLNFVTNYDTANDTIQVFIFKLNNLATVMLIKLK